MSIHMDDPRPDDDGSVKHDRKEFILTGSRTPLSARLGEIQASWLLDHVCERWETLHRHMGDWREKMKRWEEMSLEDYSSRIGRRDRNKPGENKPDIFTFQNHTLGMSAAFWDYFTAQARNDIFGTKPWLSATPEGKADIGLSERITKHAQWKLGYSNLESVAKDAISMAGWGGTAFVKSRWLREVETYERELMCAHDAATGEVLTHPETGDYIETAEQAEALGIDGAAIKWKAKFIEEVQTTYDNCHNDLIDWRDIAFNQTAPALDLRHTDVFCRFRMGILDAIHDYGIEEEQIRDLQIALGTTTDMDDDSPIVSSTGLLGIEDNPPVQLVEGFVRCDPFQTGKPIRMHVVFAPQLRVLFTCDYLANITPDGLLPVFPVRIHKRAGRILGMGWFEKYEDPNDVVDRQYNSVTRRNEESSSVLSAIQPSALADRSKAKDIVMDPTKPVELAEGKTITDLISYSVIPDVNPRSVELLNQMLQMNQMRSGITSAAQGELAGVPTSNTATGVREMMSRGAVLLKAQIDECTTDLTDLTEFNVFLLYANHDHDETFTWGEGQDAELLQLTQSDAQGIRLNVNLTLVQAQNAQKLQSATTAIQILMQWVNIPEHEKTAVRPAFVQALAALGFRNAEDIIRQAAIDLEGVLSLLPPDLAQAAGAAFVQAGLIAGEGDEASSPIPADPGAQPEPAPVMPGGEP